MNMYGMLVEETLNEIVSYYFRVHFLRLHDYRCLLHASLDWLANYVKGVRKPLESYLKSDLLVRTWDDFLFIARAGTPDLYTIAVSERFEIENWFKPLARGVASDANRRFSRCDRAPALKFRSFKEKCEAQQPYAESEHSFGK